MWGCHRVETALQASISPHQGPKGWADHREARNGTPGSWSAIAPASRKALRPPGTPQLTVEHSGCSGPTDSPLSTPYPSPGRPTTVTSSAHPPRPTPSGRILRAPQEFHQGPGRPGVTRQGLGGHPGHLEVAASARGLLTSCGVDASSDTGAGHQAGPTATSGPSPAATNTFCILPCCTGFRAGAPVSFDRRLQGGCCPGLWCISEPAFHPGELALPGLAGP